MENLLKITKTKIDNHLHYGKWYYIGAIVLVLIAVNLFYTTTEPRYPKENTVDIVMYTSYNDQEAADIWEEEMLNSLPDNQRAVNMLFSPYIAGSTETVVVARIAAQEDDIMVASLEQMQAYANQGAFLPLDELINFDDLSETYPDIDWSDYLYVATEMEEEGEHIYFLPLSISKGFNELGYSEENLGIGILVNSINAENAAICVEYLLQK